MYLDKNKVYIGLVVAAIVIAGFVYVAFFANRTQPTLTLSTVPYPYTSPAIGEINEITIGDINEINEITEAEDAQETPSHLAAPQTVVVFISGAVNYPNVFELEYGARVIDALELAGGATYYADLNRINLAAFVTDEQHIIVPAIGQELDVDITTAPNIAANAQSSAAAGGSININTADLQALTTLPGIGPVIGQSIINYREQNGPFSSIEQIQNVTRIGPAIFSNIREMITVE